MKKYYLINKKNSMMKTVLKIKLINHNIENKLINQQSQKIFKEKLNQNFLYYLKNLKIIFYYNQKLLIF